jgi:hypothetical protein
MIGSLNILLCKNQVVTICVIKLKHVLVRAPFQPRFSGCRHQLRQNNLGCNGADKAVAAEPAYLGWKAAPTG